MVKDLRKASVSADTYCICRNICLTLQLNVAYLDAILGAEYKVDTIRGSAVLNIPPGTQHGESIRLPGAGVEKTDGSDSTRKGTAMEDSGTGSHFFEVAVRVPLEVDRSERELLQQLKFFA